jgi:hypothetical protein
MTTHACSWPGCPEQVTPESFACRDHWHQLPAPMRHDLNAAWGLRRKALKAYRLARETEAPAEERQTKLMRYTSAAAEHERTKQRVYESLLKLESPERKAE